MSCNTALRDESKGLEKKVVVVDDEINVLSLTSPARARALLKNKKAFIFQHQPFIIKLNGGDFLKIVTERDPLFEITDVISSNLSTLMEFKVGKINLETIRSYFDGGRSKEYDAVIDSAISTAKKELFEKAKGLGADAISNISFTVQLEQLKSDIVITVIFQAHLCKKISA